MKTDKQIKKIAFDTIIKESEAISKLASYIDDHFIGVVKLIYNCRGRIIITGIGKSAIVANKIVATLNSTGTPAVFMHAADAIHGDLGIILEDDVVLCLSKSGNTPEIKLLVPLIKKFGNKIVALVSNTDSFLAKHSDFVINAYVESEACPNNLAPTSSTTAQMVMGDALAVCLLECRGFSSGDFAKIHPGGTLGKKLYSRVGDLYTGLNTAPKVYIDDTLKKVILEISSKRLGATVVLTRKELIAGIITDGDLRRMLEKTDNIRNLTAENIMSANPKTIDKDDLAINAFSLMKKNNITQLIVSSGKKYSGMIHLHDILKEGII